MCRRPLKPGVLYSKKVVWPTATARLGGGEIRGQPTGRPRTTDPNWRTRSWSRRYKNHHRVPSTHTHTLAQTHAHWWSWMKSSPQPGARPPSEPRPLEPTPNKVMCGADHRALKRCFSLKPAFFALFSSFKSRNNNNNNKKRNQLVGGVAFNSNVARGIYRLGCVCSGSAGAPWKWQFQVMYKVAGLCGKRRSPHNPNTWCYQRRKIQWQNFEMPQWRYQICPFNN